MLVIKFELVDSNTVLAYNDIYGYYCLIKYAVLKNVY